MVTTATPSAPLQVSRALAKTSENAYAQYSRLYQDMVTRAQEKIREADPATSGSMHLAHNWGNAQARAILNWFNRRRNRLTLSYPAVQKRAFSRENPTHSLATSYANIYYNGR